MNVLSDISFPHWIPHRLLRISLMFVKSIAKKQVTRCWVSCDNVTYIVRWQNDRQCWQRRNSKDQRCIFSGFYKLHFYSLCWLDSRNHILFLGQHVFRLNRKSSKITSNSKIKRMNRIEYWNTANNRNGHSVVILFILVFIYWSITITNHHSLFLNGHEIATGH